MQTAQNLTNLLAERGWTVERLAVALQDKGTPITTNTLHSWLSGRRAPSGRYCVMLANAMDCTTDEILRGIRPVQRDVA